MYQERAFKNSFTFSHKNKTISKFSLQIDEKASVPKYKQIVHSIINDIDRGIIKKNEQLLSITELSIEYLLSRDTVEKAYRELKDKGYVIAVQGKGYFVKSRVEPKKKILMVLNKMSPYKKLIFESFSETIGKEATIDLRIYNYEIDVFEDIIDKNLGKYNYYVIMPHFHKHTNRDSYVKVIQKIPSKELVLLDRPLFEFQKKSACIYQDFEKDIFNACEENLELFKKYKNLCFVFPENANYPEEIKQGFRSFCVYNNFNFCIETCVDNALNNPTSPTAFIVIDENDLAQVIHFSRKNELNLGKNIGILSFNDTILKELLGISVISTNFREMGKKAAFTILENSSVFEKNEFKLIDRKSL